VSGSRAAELAGLAVVDESPPCELSPGARTWSALDLSDEAVALVGGPEVAAAAQGRADALVRQPLPDA
jgi:hypothetical protein